MRIRRIDTTVWTRVIPAILLLASLACGGKGDRSTAFVATGGAAALETLLHDACRAAEPEGLVLLIVSTGAAPPAPGPLDQLARRWKPHGLVTRGLIIGASAASSSPRSGRAMAPWPSLVFDGEASDLERILRRAVDRPALLLYETNGNLLWSADGRDAVDDLDALLQDRLGHPAVASGEDGCVCALFSRSADN